jgi:hypothetical protein
VQITDGGTGVSDTLAVKGTNPASGVPGTELDTSSGTSMNSVQYNVRSSAGFAINDIVVSTLGMRHDLGHQHRRRPAWAIPTAAYWPLRVRRATSPTSVSRVNSSIVSTELPPQA